MIPIIIADDHAFIRAGVESVLRDTRYEVVASATNGREALELIEQFDPAIAILDLRMPDLDGLATLNSLRGAGDTRPVVLLTADIEDQNLLEAIKAGVNGIVLKEGAEDRLITCLDAVLLGRRSIDPDLMERVMVLSIDPPKDKLADLAARERDIVGLVARGLRNRDIANRLGLTEGTVKVYLHGIYRKMQVTSRTELVIAISDRVNITEN